MGIFPKDEKNPTAYFSPWYYYRYAGKREEFLSTQLNQISDLLQELNVGQIVYSCYRLERFCFKSSQGLLGRAIHRTEVKTKIREDRLKLKAISSLLLALEQSIDKNDDGYLFIEEKITSEEQLQSLREHGRDKLEEE